MEIVRFGVGLVLLIASGALTVQLWNGNWLSLIAKPTTTKKGTFYPEGTRKSGQRAAWVMVACFAVVGTLMAFEMAKMTGLVLFAQIASVLCNVMLVGFCVLAVWTLFSRSKGADGKLNFGGDNVRLTLLLLGSCVVLTLVSLLFA
ncbi:lipocalin [Paraeggerthella hongkongensis]|uniref:lipocalin n=1 Tax=Paraeggerthella hominis TaxID=2897351 RepID=UPI001C10F1A4|nr:MULTISPECIES: lipocalin [Paraeggerthella]MBU5404415.1 lipocalin [Paraeggerthella hongkongensis]MCD2432111.1 lipocalin [Paraeggerthella hominis]